MSELLTKGYVKTLHYANPILCPNCKTPIEVTDYNVYPESPEDNYICHYCPKCLVYHEHYPKDGG